MTLQIKDFKLNFTLTYIIVIHYSTDRRFYIHDSIPTPRSWAIKLDLEIVNSVDKRYLQLNVS